MRIMVSPGLCRASAPWSRHGALGLQRRTRALNIILVGLLQRFLGYFDTELASEKGAFGKTRAVDQRGQRLAPEDAVLSFLGTPLIMLSRINARTRELLIKLR